MKKPKKHSPQKTKKATKAAAPTNADDTIQAPFSLNHRWTPPEKSQDYLMGTVNGDTDGKQIITNTSVAMSHDFSAIMQGLLKEAKAGHFKTRGDAVRRRDELIKAAPAATAKEALPAPEVDDLEKVMQAAFDEELGSDIS